jgi:PAS domain S-box-containing protein
MTMVAGKTKSAKKRILLRMTLLSWAVLVIALGAFILASIPYQRRVFVEQLKSQGESLASSVSQVGYSSIAMSDYSGIVNHCLEVIEKNTSIRYIIVTRKDGFALVHTYDGWRQEQLNGEVWLPQTANSITIPFYSNPLVNEEVFHYSQPLDYSGLTWGWIHIGLSLDKLKQDLRVLYGRTVGLSLVCAAVGFMLSFAFAKRMTQPIIALHNATIRVRKGELTARAEVKNTGDEIESLALSFNEMAETLQISHRQLRVTNEQLRTEVVERKQAEEALRENENKYRTLLENLPQKVFSKDRNSIYVSCNENFARELGIRVEEFKGKTDYDFFPKELAEKYRGDDKRIMESGTTEDIEEKYIRNGQEMIVQTVKTPIKDEQDNIVGILGIFWDITDLKQAEAELKATQEKLIETARRAGMAEVAADVLHNVGNILNSINVSTTVIKEKVTNSELANLEKVASIINEHIDDLGMFLTEDPQGKHIPVYLTEVSKCLTDEQADIISKLKGLADNVQHIKDIVSMQQSYAKVSGAEVQTSISKLAEDAIQINSAGLERHGTRLIREFDELGDVEIDKQRVLQILVNMISNASGSKWPTTVSGYPRII